LGYVNFLRPRRGPPPASALYIAAARCTRIFRKPPASRLGWVGCSVQNTTCSSILRSGDVEQIRRNSGRQPEAFKKLSDRLRRMDGGENPHSTQTTGAFEYIQGHHAGPERRVQILISLRF